MKVLVLVFLMSVTACLASPALRDAEKRQVTKCTLQTQGEACTFLDVSNNKVEGLTHNIASSNNGHRWTVSKLRVFVK